MSKRERSSGWSNGEPARVPVSITFEGIVPLDDVVYYIRNCGQRVARELDDPARCDVTAARVAHWDGRRHFEVRIRIADREHGVHSHSVDDDLYVAIWRGFDVAMRELVRARRRVESVDGDAPATASWQDTAAGSGDD